MWIKNSNTASRRVNDPELPEPIEFDKNGKARVTDEVGRKAAEIFPTVEIIETETKEGD